MNSSCWPTSGDNISPACQIPTRINKLSHVSMYTIVYSYTSRIVPTAVALCQLFSCNTQYRRQEH